MSSSRKPVTFEVTPNTEEFSKLEKCIDLLSHYGDDSQYELYIHKKEINASLNTSVNLMGVGRGCLISHRFLEASQVLEMLCMTTTVRQSHFLRYAGFQILENHQDSSDEMVKDFVSLISCLKMLNKKEVVLEYVIYLLKQKKLKDTSNICKDFLMQSGYFRKNSIIDSALQSYFGLIEYLKWATTHRVTANVTEGNNTIPKLRSDKSVHILQMFLDLIELSGQWDFIIPKLLEVVESGRISKITAETALKKYIEKNPGHLNAYLYMYEFLREHCYNQQIQVEYLEKISQLSPSDERVLNFVLILKNENLNLETSLQLLFMFMDYPINFENLTAWKLFSDVLTQILKKCILKRKKIRKKFWDDRSYIWNKYHFDPLRIHLNVKNDRKLMMEKVKFLFFMETNAFDHPYVQSIQSQISEKLLCKMNKAISKIVILCSCQPSPEEIETSQQSPSITEYLEVS